MSSDQGCDSAIPKNWLYVSRSHSRVIFDRCGGALFCWNHQPSGKLAGKSIFSNSFFPANSNSCSEIFQYFWASMVPSTITSGVFPELGWNPTPIPRDRGSEPVFWLNHVSSNVSHSLVELENLPVWKYHDVPFILQMFFTTLSLLSPQRVG